MGSDSKPLLSIGLPVFNGEKHLSETLASIVRQSFTDFELIICDNASTDATPAICRRFAAKDSRIRYYGSEQNRGAAWNFNRAFEISKGVYFKWLMHDDIYAEDFLAECLKPLEADSGVVLSYAMVKYIDDGGQELSSKKSTLVSRTNVPHERFKDIIRMDYTCEETLGIYRSSVLRDTRLIGRFADSDRVLLSELGLRGRFHEVPDYMIYRRVHDQSSVAKYPGRHARTEWFDPSKRGKLIFPYWRQLAEYAKAVRRAPIPSGQKLNCYGHLFRWFVGNRRHLIGDIRILLKSFVLEYFPWSGPLWRRLKRSLNIGGWRSA